MRYALRFLWNATRGHRLAPWRSPYLLWRIETYCGVKMTQIGFLEFWEFMWRERSDLWSFLKWTGEMERYVHPNPNSSQKLWRAVAPRRRLAKNNVHVAAFRSACNLSCGSAVSSDLKKAHAPENSEYFSR